MTLPITNSNYMKDICLKWLSINISRVYITFFQGQTYIDLIRFIFSRKQQTGGKTPGLTR